MKGLSGKTVLRLRHLRLDRAARRARARSGRRFALIASGGNIDREAYLDALRN